jgi:hypothetical protein
VSEGDGRPVHARHVVGVPVCGGAVIGRDQQLVVRDEARGAADKFVVRGEQACFPEPRTKLVVEKLVDALARDGNAEQEEPDEHRQLVGLADPMQVGRQLGRPQQEVVAGREQLLDSFRFIARDAE